MDQRSSAQGQSSPLACELMLRQPVQLAIQPRERLLRRSIIGGASSQQCGDVAARGRHLWIFQAYLREQRSEPV